MARIEGVWRVGRRADARQARCEWQAVSIPPVACGLASIHAIESVFTKALNRQYKYSQRIGRARAARRIYCRGIFSSCQRNRCKRKPRLRDAVGAFAFGATECAGIRVWGIRRECGMRNSATQARRRSSDRRGFFVLSDGDERGEAGGAAFAFRARWRGDAAANLKRHSAGVANCVVSTNRRETCSPHGKRRSGARRTGRAWQARWHACRSAHAGLGAPASYFRNRISNPNDGESRAKQNRRRSACFALKLWGG